MYVPKMKTVSLPSTEVVRMEIQLAYLPEATEIIKRTWSKVIKFSFRDNSGGKGVSNYHRGPMDIFGDHGYYRVATFINLYLHENFRGSNVLSSFPTHRPALKLDKSATASKKIDRSLDHNDTLTLESAAVLDYFFKLPAVVSFNAAMFKIEDLRSYVTSLSSLSYLSSHQPGATLFNVLLYYVKTMKLLWLDTSPLSEDDDLKTARINVSYKTFDVIKSLLNFEFEEFFQHHVLSQVYNDLIDALQQTSLISRHAEFTTSGPQIALDFFNSWTDSVIKSLAQLTSSWYDLRTKGSAFFSEYKRYHLLAKCLTLKPELLVSRTPTKGQQFLLGFFEGDVDLSKGEVDDFLSHFESEYATLISLWVSFVDTYYSLESKIPGGLKPSVTAYCAEIGGSNTIYGMVLSSPFSRTSVSIKHYHNGREYGDVNVSIPNTSSSRIINTKTVDETVKGVKTSLFDVECADLFTLMKMNLRTPIIEKRSPSSDIWRLYWNEKVTLIVPPINPVSNHKLAWSPGDFPADASVYVPYTVDLEKLSARDIMFVFRVDEFSISHGYPDSDVRLKDMFEKRLQDLCVSAALGPQHLIKQVTITRATVMSTAALFAATNPRSSEYLMKFVEVDVDFSSLDTVQVGADLIVPRDLLIPFPYSTLSSDADQVEIMKRNTVDGRFPCLLPIEGKDKESILTCDGVTVDLNAKYTIFSPDMYLGVSKLKLHQHIFTDLCHQLSSTEKDWKVRLTSLLSKTEESVLYMTYTDNSTEMDFVDPYPGLAAPDASIQLLASVLTDTLFSQISSPMSSFAIDLTRSAKILQDIYTFWKLCLGQNGRVAFSGKFIINQTWKQMVQIFADTYEKSLEVIKVWNSTYKDEQERMIAVAEVNAIFAHSFRKACFNMREDSPVFWSKSGFQLEKLYFGDVYRLLEDKLAGRLRYAMKPMSMVDIRYVGLPLLVPGVNQTVTRDLIKMNAGVCLWNTLGKSLYPVS